MRQRSSSSESARFTSIPIKAQNAYAEVGSRLTALFTALRSIYHEVKREEREQWPESDELVKRYRRILKELQEIGIARQIFLSDWYAHYNFNYLNYKGNIRVVAGAAFVQTLLPRLVRYIWYSR